MAGPDAFLLVDHQVDKVAGSGGGGVVVAGDAGGVNSIVATSFSIRGYGKFDIIQDIADQSKPLSLATFRIHHHDPDTRKSTSPARVVGTEGPFILLHVPYQHRGRIRFGQIKQEGHELLLYHNSQPPAILAVAGPPSDLKLVDSFAILPRGHQAESFILAAVDVIYSGGLPTSDCMVMVYSSEHQSWSTNVVPGPSWSTGASFRPDKAIAVGEKQAVFADLVGGVMLFADFSSDPPVFKYLHCPSGGVSAQLEMFISPKFSDGFCRDISFSDGLIKFAVIQNAMTISSQPCNTMDPPVLKDIDLIPSLKRSRPEPNVVCDVTGRKLMIWSRTTISDAWSGCIVVDLDQIHLAGFTSRRAHLHYPVISVDGNTIYLRAVQNFGDEAGIVVSLDLQTKGLTPLAPFPVLPMERRRRPLLFLKDPQ